jgi:predicted dehydrogenase
VEAAARWGVLSAGGETRPVPSEPGAYQRYYAGVVASLQRAAPPPVDPEDAVTVLEIIAAARRSAATREHRFMLPADQPPQPG